jgi:hypothetical protein
VLRLVLNQLQKFLAYVIVVPSSRRWKGPYVSVWKMEREDVMVSHKVYKGMEAIDCLFAPIAVPSSSMHSVALPY